MKLTRQNKLMKSQFQKTQARLKAAAVSDADSLLLRKFLEHEVGLDVASCQKTAEGDEPQGASIDVAALKERYEILRVLKQNEFLESKAPIPVVESVDLLNLSPVEKSKERQYEEIDLMGENVQQSQLDEAMKQVERMRQQMKEGAEQTEELQRRFTEREEQQETLRRQLEEKNKLLQERAQEMQNQQSETEAEWNQRWEKQSELVASLQQQESKREGQEERQQKEQEQELERLNELKRELESRVRELSQLLDAGVKQRENEQQAAAQHLAEIEQEKVELDEQLRQAQETVASATGIEDQLEGKVTAALEAQRSELEAAKAENVRLHEQLKTLQDTSTPASSASEVQTEDAQTIESLRAEISSLESLLETRESDSKELQQEIATMKEQQVKKVQDDASNDRTADATLMQELERVKMESAEHVHELQALQKKLRAAEERLTKANSESECTNSLVEALKEDTSRLADQVAQYELKQAASEKELSALTDAKRQLEEQQELDREARVAMEKQLVEERAYWTSKLEGLITDSDAATTKTETLEAELREKQKQVTKMAASQTSMTTEMMELQKQLSGMREDLAMAAEGLEAHATKAETNERRFIQSEKEVAELKNQLEEMREKHHDNFEMLRREKESELERVQKEHRTLTAEKKELSREKDELQSLCQSLERELTSVRKHEGELEASLSDQTFQVGNLSVDLAETKKSLSDRMAHATRLQTENMGMAGKLAEQVALIESALRDAAHGKAAQKEMEVQVQTAKADVQCMKQSEAQAKQDVENLRLEIRKQEDRFQKEREEAKQALQHAVGNEKLSFKREVERLEAESKHKSKLALQAVLEKEKEIARLSTRLGVVEEDVRSGDADNRKILEFAQLQAKREAEAREQAAEMQALSDQLEEAQRELQELRDDKRRHAEELTAMLQNQRRDGVNMEYLKNVVVQYMSFRPGSSQQARLIPVLTTLLQFTAADTKEIKHATRRGNSWTSWGTSDTSLDYKPIVVD
ncbi:hypothetical protein BBO99_00004760 [Phytophthora kernoviae]|uniref:GRIP domain-containing protein n=2 Tax=Phytophthora kernoviae TaxID=325452 RepID=A0A3R7HIS8_9STRA|nr:hypothetical protein G195_005422 [Phytophthora kernoviae 00238/432]KAG2524993.1 hypothetical protein JM16_004418 [Phytophthora kernoviae]KAG2526763.1 hypothetical protein JM18_004209 [Phytophthora kernoviae]RLN14427.1 hypothetical protein BBI17_004779 [Phytophthora kernoviae]RLN80100.1 hypothetical protein BBO99_00004760 [Phytophthora kernoviae]